MALGYCSPILLHLEALAGCSPSNKLSPMGMTQAVLANQDGSAELKNSVNAGYEDGHTAPVSIVYSERVLEDEVSDTPNACDTASTPAKKEFTLPALSHRSVSFFLPDSLLRNYCRDVSQYVKLNASGVSSMNKETSVMREVYDNFINYGGALLKSINTLLVTQMSTQFGKNVVSGSSETSSIQFSLGKNGMQDAFVRLMSDMRMNEICDSVTMVGNGDFANIDLIRQWFSNGAAANGMDKAAMLRDIPNVFFDKSTASIWGANHIGVFEKGSLALINRLMYSGGFARKLGNSELFSMALPVNEYCCPQDGLDRLMFDVQIREIDCPTPLAINGGASANVGQGVQVILSWNGALFVKPDTLYADEDELEGTNGTLHYEISACDEGCDSL